MENRSGSYDVIGSGEGNALAKAPILKQDMPLIVAISPQPFDKFSVFISAQLFPYCIYVLIYRTAFSTKSVFLPDYI